jgi:flagellar assembly protein FliH
MMISPSENTASEGENLHMGYIPVLNPGERRYVSPLEFHPVAEVEDFEHVAIEEITSPSSDTPITAAPTDQLLLIDEMSEQLRRVRTEARNEARLESEQELKDEIARERLALKKASESFLRERNKYFSGVEAEVVKLALAIAERVLHREVKLDPLLLAGVVRVALEKIVEDSTLILRVPVETCDAWRDLFSTQRPAVEVVGDELLNLGDCVLETSIGKVQLGIAAQLKEIERGFFDLMQHRPA